MSADTSADTPPLNAFTRGRIGPTLVRTALPIVFVMSMNGLLTVVDAMFLGLYVGPDALSAVTLMFPAYMLIVALATLVASGMSSVLARHLGGGRTNEARAVFAGAHGLALAMACALVTAFLLFGDQVTLAAAEGSIHIASMARVYLSITVWCSPLLFVLSVNLDALRNEGRVVMMAGLSLFVSLANIAFNYLLIVVFDFGVAGTAYGTAMAQLLAFSIVLAFRMRGQTVLRPAALLRFPPTAHWGSILALGAPQSLNFIGIGLGSAATFAVLQLIGEDGYEATIAAFGIVTRIMTFAYLPLLGLTQAIQAMVGNNYGAGLWPRSDATLRLGLLTALAYCLVIEVFLAVFAGPTGALFVNDVAVVSEVSRILPVMIIMYFAAGPLFVIASYFQAIGDAKRAAVLSLVKPYLFFLPLVFSLPVVFGESAIWFSGPASEVCLLVLTLVVLSQLARSTPARWGLFLARTQ